MAGKGFADIVFCIDASASMQPCFKAVASNIEVFLQSLNSNKQMQWESRLEFIAHSASCDYKSVYRHISSSYSGLSLIEALYHAVPESKDFFTTDQSHFVESLQKVKASGDEMPLVALDFCLDLPWRTAQECHRIIIMITDEPLETAMAPKEMTSKLDAIIEKIHKLKVILFLVAPGSPGYEKLASADKCEYEAVTSASDGLESTDFSKILQAIGKSISVSTMQSRPEPAKRGLFGQARWKFADRSGYVN